MSEEKMSLDEALSSYSKYPTLTSESGKYFTSKWIRLKAELAAKDREIAEAKAERDEFKRQRDWSTLDDAGWKGEALKQKVCAERAEKELADWKQNAKDVMAERCPDEKHCTCVPLLRRELAAKEKDSFAWQSAALEAGRWREVERERAEKAEAECKAILAERERRNR